MKSEFSGNAAYFKQLSSAEVKLLKAKAINGKLNYILVDSPAILGIDQCKEGVIVKTFGSYYICDKIKIEKFNRRNVNKIVFQDGDKVVCFAEL